MSTLKLSKISEQDYVQGELHSEVRHEFIGGEVYAMAGAGEAHNIIAGNIFAKLRESLRGSPCRVFIADMKLRVREVEAYYYPDVLVTCDAADNDAYFKERPSLVVEVLSASTERIDRREKLLAYRTLPSLREYVLVSSEARRVEIYRLGSGGVWQGESVSETDGLRLDTVNVTMKWEQIYEDVRFESR